MAIAKRLFILIMISTIFIGGCKKDNTPKEITSADVEKAFQEISLTPGVQDISLEVANDVFYNFRIIVPDVDMSKSWPFIMAFHGESNGNPDAHKGTECYIEPGFEGLDAFIIHPNAGTQQWYEQFNQIKVINLMSWATKFWPVDFNKIVAAGYSNGGNASWFFAEQAPHIFSAAIPIASSYDLSINDSTSRKLDIPIYAIHGENDELFPIEITKKWVDESIKAGSDITWVEATGKTHFKPCEYVEYVQGASDWLKNIVFK